MRDARSVPSEAVPSPAAGRAAARGYALVDAIAAVALLAVAAAVVASAATAGLRAVRRAADLARVTALASRALATVQSRGAPEGLDDEALAEPGLRDVSLHRHVVRRDDGVAELEVTARAGRESVTLATRMWLGH